MNPKTPSKTHEKAEISRFTTPLPLSARIEAYFAADDWRLVKAPSTGSLFTPRWIGRRGDDTALIWGFTFAPPILRILGGFQTMYWQPDLDVTHRYVCTWEGLLTPLNVEDLRDAGIRTVLFQAVQS